MPLYDYRCPECGHTEEIRHDINDIGVFMCTNCTDETIGPVKYLKRMISVPGIVFKGSGFYRNDNRPKPPPPKPAEKKEKKKETTNDL